MFSQTSEYALRVVVYLAGQGEAPATTRQIAQVTRVPEGYLSKVLQSLGRAGLVSAQRGLHGGFVLERDPAQLTVYQVIEAVDSIPRIRTCPLSLQSHSTKLCPLHQRMDDALASVEKVFRESSIADMIDGSSTSIPLCEIEGIVPKGKKTKSGK